jgi:hypothetical protein
VAEWFKAAVLKTARGRKVPRGFESHPFRQWSISTLSAAFAKLAAAPTFSGFLMPAAFDRFQNKPRRRCTYRVAYRGYRENQWDTDP